jgi:hypothetical protein
MGRVTRRECLGTMIVPDKYWISSYDNFKWVTKESKCQKASKR